MGPCVLILQVGRVGRRCKLNDVKRQPVNGLRTCIYLSPSNCWAWLQYSFLHCVVLFIIIIIIFQEGSQLLQRLSTIPRYDALTIIMVQQCARNIRHMPHKTNFLTIKISPLISCITIFNSPLILHQNTRANNYNVTRLTILKRKSLGWLVQAHGVGWVN